MRFPLWYTALMTNPHQSPKEKHDKPQPNPNRHFTILEIAAYLSSITVLIGVVCTVVPPFVFAFPILFGSYVGLVVAGLFGGRRWAVGGAVCGGIISAVHFVMYVVLPGVQ